MFNEAVNLAVAQTELDGVFYQEFEYDTKTPFIATAQSAELFKPMNTTHATYIHDIFKGSNLFGAIGETATVPLATPRVTNKQTIVISDFAEGIEISKNLFDDNLHEVWARAVQDFARMARISQDFNAFKVFRLGFTTQLTADGSSWFNASHALIGGGTQSNLLTSPAPLTDDNFNLAIINLRQQKNQAGVVMGSIPAILLVPSPLYKKALQLVESALISETAENALNVYRSAYDIKVMTSPYLDSIISGGSDTAWFLLGRNHSVYRIIRQGIETALRPWQMSNNRTYFYQANFREEVFVADYIGSCGATGV